MKIVVVAALALALWSGPALTQSHPVAGNHGPSPYTGMEQREIKALSDEKIADLRAGRGMSMALPAELNGYPGPSHALDLAGPLRLSPDQRIRTQVLFDEMQRAASALGQRVIESERSLDLLFAEGQATPRAIAAATAESARLQGALRAVHLQYHLEMLTVLDADQVARYTQLRGYGGEHRH